MEHHTTITVRFADLDPWGHVNHARYFGYFESARIELLEEIGFGILEMGAGDRQIVLVQATARFVAPTGLHDTLDIATRVDSIGRASSHWHQEARRDGRTMAQLEIRAAFTDAQGHPARPPAGFSEAISRYVGSGEPPVTGDRPR